MLRLRLGLRARVTDTTRRSSSPHPVAARAPARAPHLHVTPDPNQVGCARACRFCSTGTMGLVRNLDAHEIVHQVWLAQRFVREQR